MSVPFAELPTGHTSRAATMEDLDATADMFELVNQARFGESEPGVRGSLESTWRSSFVELPTMTQLVVSPQGEVVGYGELECLDPTSSVGAFLCVHPAHTGRGIGSWLISWAEDAAARLIPAGTESRLRNTLSSEDGQGLDLVRSRGYRQVRTFWHMKMELGLDVERGSPPARVEIRHMIEEKDERSVHEVLEEAFEGHFGFEPISFDRWLSEVRGSDRYDPSMILVAEEAGHVVGVSMQDQNEGVGWVGELGVRPSHQGHGIGRALLRHALHDLARRGLSSVQLNVDSENERGATRLYESVGMSLRRSWPVFEKRIVGTKLPA